MNQALLSRLIGEISPQIAGAGVTRVHWLADEALALKLAAVRPSFLVISISRALPLIFLADTCPPPTGAKENRSPDLERELKGATIQSMTAARDRTAAEFSLVRTHATGFETKRTLVVELGSRPGIVVRPTARPRSSEDEEHNTSPQEPAVDYTGSAFVTSWTDNQERTHVRLSDRRSSDAHAGDTRTFDSVNDAAAHAFHTFFDVISMDHRRAAVSRLVLKRLARKRRAIAKVEAEIADSQNADEHRTKGQLILARKGDIPRGAQVAHLKDFDESSIVEIAINPSLSPTQNAENYFKRARKAARRGAKAPARLGELEVEAEKLEAVGASIADASIERLAEIEKRFRVGKAVRSRGRSTPPRAHFRTYVVSGGWEVLVGRSNKDNDILTHRIANQSDLWFHARQAAGSHVILRIPSGKARPDRRAILEAAAIAAFHSKAGRSSKVSVSYTEKRHVRKPRGAKPGLAVISREKSVMVRPQIPQT